MKKIDKEYSFGLASAWFGSNCGPGFASGQLAVTYFISYGWFGTWTCWICIGLIGIMLLITAEICRYCKCKTYMDFAHALYAPFGKYLAWMYELAIFIVVFVGGAATLAGAGQILESATGLPYLLCVAIFGIISSVVIMYGRTMVLKASSIFAVILFLTLGAFSLVTIITQIDNIRFAMSTRWTPMEGMSWLPALLSACTFFLWQGGTTSTVASLVSEDSSRKSHLLFAIIGWLLNAASMCLICFALLGYGKELLLADAPINNPVLWVIQNKTPSLFYIYFVAYFFALLSTAVPMFYSTAKRLDKALSSKWLGGDERKRLFALSTIIIIICALPTPLGLAQLVAKGMTWSGILSLVVIIIPVFTVGIYRVYKGSKNEVKNAMTDHV